MRQLILRAQNGDLDAYGDLVRRFQNMAYGYAYAILGDCHLSEDAAQEAFLEAYERLADLRAPEAFGGWLRKIVFKHCDRLTRRKRVEAVDFDHTFDVASNRPGPDELVEQREMQKRVAEMIQSLPEPERVVTSMFYMNEYSLKEVAAFLEIPISTVKNRLHTSRKLLKERMMHMVDEGLNAVRLPERFADVVVQMQFVIGHINPLKSRMQALSDTQLRGKHHKLQRRFAEGEARDTIKAEAFALIREACRRAVDAEHYDMQLVASMMLDEGWVAEVASGEGKSIICLPAAYMAVLEGKRVHVVTINDDLTKRDAEMANGVFALLGITVGQVVGGIPDKEERENRRLTYVCDIVYGSYTTFAFDYLQDCIRNSDETAMQSELDFAIVGEVDRVLIDECRTPLIIAKKVPVETQFYHAADQIARKLIRRQEESKKNVLFKKDPKNAFSFELTKAGKKEVHGLVDSEQTDCNQVVQALRAHLLYEKDRDYMVQDGRVIILDRMSLPEGFSKR